MNTANKPIIVHVLNGLPFGGNENLCLQVLHQSPKKFKNILINLFPNRMEMLSLFQKIQDLQIINCSYQTNKILSFLFFFSRMKTILIKYQPQAVLLYSFSLPQVLVAIAARVAQINKIAIRPGNPPPKNVSERYKWQILVQTCRWLGVSIHCCSQSVHEQFQSLGQLPHGSFPIPNGCNVEDISQRATQIREQSLHSETLVIGMVARLNAIKDHDTLIRAFAIVQKKFPNTALWIIGDGDNKPQLQNLARELEVDKQVVFWGSRSDVPELLGQMDIYAFSTSSDEGFGIALIEAMAAQLPIIASDVAACREVLANGQAGLLVSPKNPEAFANTLYQLLVSQEQRKHRGEKGFAHALSNYTSQACAGQWYQLLAH